MMFGFGLIKLPVLRRECRLGNVGVLTRRGKGHADPLDSVPSLKDTSKLDEPIEMMGDVKVATKDRIWSDESFVINLFRGVMHSRQVFPYPLQLNPEEENELKNRIGIIENYLLNVNDPINHDKSATLSTAEMNALHKAGAFIVGVPKEFGGLGFNHVQNVRIVQTFGMYDLSLAGIFGGHQCLGYKGIKLFGTLEQRKKYYHQIVHEKKVACFALTEPGAESDVASITARAVLSRDGSHYIINGIKSAVINGSIADIITIFCVTESSEKELEITAFVVNKSMGGITASPPIRKMGMHGTDQSRLLFTDVKVPKENVIGKPGDGYRIAMNIVNHSRFGIAAALSGAMRAIITKSVQYSIKRKQFGRRINTFGAIQGKLAAMAMKQYVCECVAYMIAGNMDEGHMDFYVEAAISKCLASRCAWDVVDDAMQIFGGAGYIRRTGLERLMRDIRWYRVYGGTNDVIRLFIALTGIQHAGVEIEELQLAYRNPSTHLGLIFGQPHRSSVEADVGFHGMTPSIAHLVHPRLHVAANVATQSITKFGNVVELLLERYGRNVVEKQFFLIQLANAAIYTYAMVATLSRCTKSIYMRSDSVEHEITLTQAFCLDASNKVSVNLDGLEGNSHLALGNKMEILIDELTAAGGCVNKGPLGY